LLIAALCAAPSFAFAQAAPAPAASPAADAPVPPSDAPAVPAAVPVEESPADAVAPAPTLSDVSAKLDGLEEAYSGTKATVDSLSKIKVSGYIQGRLELHEFSKNGVDSTNRPTVFDKFYVRRGRLKVTYAGQNAEYMLQIDATGSGVVLKDAEASFVDTWTPFNFKLTAGQFKVPFGYEVLQSSGDREMPERSRFIRQFFPNERDRGLRLQATRDWFRFSAAVVNGNFIQDSIYPDSDPNGAKDVIGRVGGDFDWLVVGLSGSYGKAMTTTLGRAATVSGSGSNITVTPAVLTDYKAYNRTRVGADVQAYLDVPSVGGLALKGEFAWQNDNNVALPGRPASDCNDISAMGWYVAAIQNIGDYVGVVARLDQFIYNNADRTGCTASLMATPTDRKTTTLGGGFLLYGSANIKFSAIGEKVFGYKVETDPAKYGTFDDRITFQMQAKF
jgi:hypothetical protein